MYIDWPLIHPRALGYLERGASLVLGLGLDEPRAEVPVRPAHRRVDGELRIGVHGHDVHDAVVALLGQGLREEVGEVVDRHRGVHPRNVGVVVTLEPRGEPKDLLAVQLRRRTAASVAAC